MLIRTVIVSLLLILRNMLLTTIISPINFYSAVFNSTLQHFSQWLWLRLKMRLSKLSLASHTKPKGPFNYYFLTKWPKFGLPLLPLLCTCSFLVTPLSANFTPFQHHHYPIVKSCYFIDSWTPVIISTYKCNKKYSHDMNVPSILINTNGVYY